MNEPFQASCPEDFPLAAYRDRTITMLRRYARAAVETGRLPSLLGREFFRARVTSYTLHTFEDAIIFVFDMERCLADLTPYERTLIARVVLQEYTQEEIARMMRIHQCNVRRNYLNAVDHLTEILLERALLNPSILAHRERRRAHADCSVTEDVPVAPDSTCPTDSLTQVPAIVIDLQACQEPKKALFAASA
jgi:hypothetical protein